MSIVLLRVIDLETTGLAPPASVVEIGWCDVHFEPETKRVEIGAPKSKLFKPAEPMTPEVIAVHHLTDAMLAGLPECTVDDLKEVARADSPQFLCAASCDFEQKWITQDITQPFGERSPPRWICTVKAASRLFPDAQSHSNQATRYRLGLDLPESVAMPPHRAGPDSFVTAHILGRFLQTERVASLVHWTTLPKWMPNCPIGKLWRGKPWAEVDEGFLNWMRGADIDDDAKHWALVELERRYPRAAGAAP